MTPVQARALYASMGTVIRLPPDEQRRFSMVSNGSPPKCLMASLEDGSCQPSTRVAGNNAERVDSATPQ